MLLLEEPLKSIHLRAFRSCKTLPRPYISDTKASSARKESLIRSLDGCQLKTWKASVMASTRGEFIQALNRHIILLFLKKYVVESQPEKHGKKGNAKEMLSPMYH